METAAILRSFHGAIGTIPHAQSFLEKPVISVSNASLCKLSITQASTIGGRLILSSVSQRRLFLACAKALEATTAATSGDTSEKASGSVGKKIVQNSTFPNGFEALIMEVCDETDVAEVKFKIGDFQMHLKRNIGAPKASTPIVSPTTAPPIPSEPMVESATAAPPAAPQKFSPVSVNPFTKATSESASKLSALEASGSSGYVLVSSPTVGSFRSGRTVKGKKQPPSCKEGDLIKEGQTIGYLDQFGNELPVKSDVAGEVLKLLYKDGEAVGYGDPLVAVLPSFHGINK